ALVSRTHDRDLARMIARRLALLVAALVLLVDDDRAEIPERREDRGPRSHRNAFLPTTQGEPGVVPLPIAERRVQHGDHVAEHESEAIHGLWRERDLRHEHDRGLATVTHDALEQLDVDERLSTARD